MGKDEGGGENEKILLIAFPNSSVHSTYFGLFHFRPFYSILSQFFYTSPLGVLLKIA